MANVLTTPGTLILDTAATIYATGTKVKVRGFTFTGAGPCELQNGAGAPSIRLGAGPIAIWCDEKPIVLNGLIVAAGISGTMTIWLG